MQRLRSGELTGEKKGARSSEAFTLIELLIVVSIIAILIAIMTPVLMSARAAARNTLCLGNLSQIGVAWAAWFTENRYFPTTRSYDSQGRPVFSDHWFDWGGADTQTIQSGYNKSDRPLNPYMASPRIEKGRNYAFLCPDDDNVKFSGEDANQAHFDRYEDWFWYRSTAQDVGDTTYARRGNSYHANDWIWAPVGRILGYVNPQDRRYELRARNMPEWVRRPSHFILVGDHGPFYMMRSDEESRRRLWGIQYSWWHGEERCNLVFLDGAARQVQSNPGDAVGDDWMFWFDEDLHRPRSFVFVRSGLGTPQDRMP